MKEKNIVWSDGYIRPEDFERRNNHKGCVVWFTGLSGGADAVRVLRLRADENTEQEEA